jgi:hypothetical protein
LGFIADALTLIRQKQYESAAKALTEHVNDADIKATSRISLMEWIAECYSKTDNKHEAARWLESAAKSALACDDYSDYEKKRVAMRQLEQAIDYYYTENDTQGFKRVTALKHSMG